MRNQSTPSQTLDSAGIATIQELKEALSDLVAVAVRRELASRSGPAANGDISTSLLVAVHEMQEMLQGIQSAGSESIQELKILLDRGSGDTLSLAGSPAIERLASDVSEAVKTSLRPVLDVLGTQRSDEASAIQETGSSLGNNRWEGRYARMATRLGLAEVTRIEGPPNNCGHLALVVIDDRTQDPPPNPVERLSAALDPLQQQLALVTDKIADLFENNDRTLKAADAVESVRSSLGDSEGIAKLLKSLQQEIVTGLRDLQAMVQANAPAQSAYHDLERTLSNERQAWQAHRARASANMESLAEQHRRTEETLKGSRLAVASKEAQIELLKQDLLNRATQMDREQKERDQGHAAQLSEYKALFGAMQAELTILRDRLDESKREKEELLNTLERSQDRLHDQERDSHRQIVALREHNASLKATLDSLQHSHKLQVSRINGRCAMLKLVCVCSGLEADSDLRVRSCPRHRMHLMKLDSTPPFWAIC